MAPTAASPAPRSTPAILALYVKIGACLLAIGADVRRIVVAGELRDGRALVDQLLGADQLVAVATVLELAALVVALGLCARWALTVHRVRVASGGAPLLAGDARLRRLVGVWAAVLTAAVLAVVVTRVGLGSAEDVADRQRIDTLRAAATGLSGVATAVTIVVVAAVTRRQDAGLAEVGGRSSDPGSDGLDRVSEGGLRVVSEEQARRGSGAL